MTIVKVDDCTPHSVMSEEPTEQNNSSSNYLRNFNLDPLAAEYFPKLFKDVSEIDRVKDQSEKKISSVAGLPDSFLCSNLNPFAAEFVMPPTLNSLNQVNYKNDLFPMYENLPDVVLFRIFSYLGAKDRRRAGRVCTRWYNVSRSCLFWKNIEAKDMTGKRIEKLLQVLPGSPKTLRICNPESKTILLNWSNFVSDLSASCSRLQFISIENYMIFANVTRDYYRSGQKNMLFHQFDAIDDAYLDNDKVIHLLTKYAGELIDIDSTRLYSFKEIPQLLHTLSLRNCIFNVTNFFSEENYRHVRNIRILDLSYCLVMNDRAAEVLTRFVDLEELYLTGCPLSDSGVSHLLKHIENLSVLDIESTGVFRNTFSALKAYGCTLTKLYIGNTIISDVNVNSILEDKRCLPNLKDLCLAKTTVTRLSISNVLQSRSSLKNVTIRPCNYPNALQYYHSYLNMQCLMRALTIVDCVKKMGFGLNKNCCDHFLKSHLQSIPDF